MLLRICSQQRSAAEGGRECVAFPHRGEPQAGNSDPWGGNFTAALSWLPERVNSQLFAFILENASAAAAAAQL